MIWEHQLQTIESSTIDSSLEISHPHTTSQPGIHVADTTRPSGEYSSPGPPRPCFRCLPNDHDVLFTRRHPVAPLSITTDVIPLPSTCTRSPPIRSHPWPPHDRSQSTWRSLLQAQAAIARLLRQVRKLRLPVRTYSVCQTVAY